MIFPVVFKSGMKNKIKIKGKREFLHQNLFLKKSILVFGATLKQITERPKEGLAFGVYTGV